MLLETRRLMGHRGTGWPDGVGARGTPFAAGLLSDGALELDEMARLLRLAATPRPQEHPDDGLMHWTGGLPNTVPADPAAPGENPYCTGCWTLPAAWRDIPAEGPTYPVLGYGALDAAAVDHALRLLGSESAVPDRSAEDAFFAADQAARDAFDALP